MKIESTILPGRVAMLGVFLGAVLLAGCGVKSSPALPEDATYPRVYPAPAGVAADRAAETGVPARRTTTGSDSSSIPAATDDTYVPPAPATEILAQ